MIAGIMLLVTLLSLLAAEGLVRVLAPQQLILVRPDIWQPVDSLGWMHRPWANTLVNTGERTVRWRTDARGYRTGSAGPAARGEDETSLLLLGDSFMAALQVDYEQSFAGLIEEHLTDRIGGPVRVDNAAVGAWDPPHYLIHARRVIPGNDYDLVVVAVYLGNDVVPARIEAYPERSPTEIASLRWPRAVSRSELIEAIARPINDFLKMRSHLFILAKNGLDGILARLGLTAATMPDEIQVQNSASSRWQVTTEILADLEDVAKEEGIPVLFILVPSKYQIDPDLLRSRGEAFGFEPAELDPDQPNRILGALMTEAGLSVVDPLPQMREAREEGLTPYGSVDPHFSPEGHLALWRTVSDTIAALLRR